MNSPAQSDVGGLKSAGGGEAAPLFVTVEDHFNGFKKLLVETRAGVVDEITLRAPARKLTRTRLNRDVPAEDFPWHVVSLCLDRHLVEEKGEAWLDQLTPDSAALVEVTAFCLTFGMGAQKKIEQAALATDWANTAPSSASAVPAGPGKNVTPGAGPSSGSGSPSPSSKS